MSGMDSLNEFYVHENMQLLEQLEEILLGGQSDTGSLGKEEIEEIFRTMHTIKGSSAMMGYDSITKLTHSIEDVFDEIRSGLELSSDKWEELIDIVLSSIDFLKEEMLNIQDGLLPEASIDELHEKVVNLLKRAKESDDEKVSDIELPQSCDNDNNNEQTTKDKYFYIKVLFENGCGMEGIRAFGVVNSIENMCSFIKTIPEDLMGECDDTIIKDGFILYVKTSEEKSVLEKPIKETMFLESFEIKEVTDKAELENIFGEVNLSNNDTVNGVVEVIDNSSKEELNEAKEKVKEEVKEIKEETKKEEVAKSDVDKKIEKEVKQEKNVKKENNQSHAHNKNSYLTVNISKVDTLMNLVGEIVTTESMVEKQSQLENFDRDLFEKQAISDPLMHMVRNSMDHGIETPEERKLTSKPEKATVTLEAKNTGGDVVIIIKDDGRGLDKESIVKKAIEKGITNKNIEDISDKEAYNFILAPGFSTKEAVSEYSGRGVGMDVVYTNIRKLRGSIRHGAYEIVQNPNGEEHSIIRGNCYKIRRLSNILGMDKSSSDEGVMILVESEMGSVCIIVDSIIGQQQVVIKPVPTLLTQFEKVHSYISGCSILEDGSISLIFDVNAIIN